MTPAEILAHGDFSLVVLNGAVTRTFTGRGVSDLYNLLTLEPALLKGASIADKVVGKGAAALMILGKVSRLHAAVISEAALDLFAGSDVGVTYTRRVPSIINRAGTGPCPVESLCAGCSTPAECLPLISSFLHRSDR